MKLRLTLTKEHHLNRNLIIFLFLNRKCIGAKMGKIQSILGLFLLMSKYNVSFTDESFKNGELKLHASGLVLTPLEKFNFKVEKR